jgi:integrase
VNKERVRENPVKKVKAPKGAQPGEAINPLNEEQVPNFLEHAKNDRHFQLWLTFLGTGCRSEELLALKRMKLVLILVLQTT